MFRFLYQKKAIPFSLCPAVILLGISGPVLAENLPAVPVTNVSSEELVSAPPSSISTDDVSTPEEAVDIPINAPISPTEGQPTVTPRPYLKPSPETGGELKVLELFSTQACTFCPKADNLMKQLVKRPNLIALSCHIDYFDVAEGSLALPICSTRQKAYETSLGVGPKYTPQMVVNGRYDAIGYLLTELDEALAHAEATKISEIKIKKVENSLFTLEMPEDQIGAYKTWLLVFDKPHAIQVASGANRGKEMTYYNVVSKAGFLGAWDGKSKTLKFDAKMDDKSKGFAILTHDESTNHIIAAGQFLK